MARFAVSAQTHYKCLWLQKRGETETGFSVSEDHVTDNGRWWLRPQRHLLRGTVSPLQ